MLVGPLGQEDPWRRTWQPLQYSCLGNPMDRGVRWAKGPVVTESRTGLKQLSTGEAEPCLAVP